MENAIDGKADGLFSHTNYSDRLAPGDETLIELRQDLDRVVTDWNEFIHQAAARSAAAASETVRLRPWTSVAIAAAAGALLEVALSASRRPTHRGAAADANTPLVPRVRSRPWTVDIQPLTSRLSQTWDSIAALNTNALPAFPAMDALASFVKAVLSAKTGG